MNAEESTGKQVFGNPALVLIGCKACPQNTMFSVEPAQLPALDSTIGQTTECPDCHTKWVFSGMETRGLHTESGRTLFVVPTFVPLMTKDTPVSLLRVIPDTFEEHAAEVDEEQPVDPEG